VIDHETISFIVSTAYAADVPPPTLDQIKAAGNAVSATIKDAEAAYTALMPILAFVGAVAHMVAWLPKSGTDGVWAIVRKGLDLIAGNYKNAANKP
jgi:hypothetical protein